MDGRTALFLSSYEGHKEAVCTLADRGADVNEQIDGGWTALHAASRKGHPEAVHELIDRGADVNA